MFLLAPLLGLLSHFPRVSPFCSGPRTLPSILGPFLPAEKKRQFCLVPGTHVPPCLLDMGL